jgi:hypothetical protein
MTISIEYKLTGRGWAKCIINIDDRQACLTAAYLSDALANLLYAMIDMVKGSDRSTATFAEEPGEYRWCFQRVSQDRICVRILWFEETFSKRPDEEGKLILEAECRLRTFAGAVLSASQQVLSKYGLDGYREQWVNNDFPSRLQVKLKESLTKKPT